MDWTRVLMILIWLWVLCSPHVENLFERIEEDGRELRKDNAELRKENAGLCNQVAANLTARVAALEVAGRTNNR